MTANIFKCYDTVRVLSSGEVGEVIEINDGNGEAAPHYLIELIDKSTRSDLSDVLVWCDWSEIELVK